MVAILPILTALAPFAGEIIRDLFIGERPEVRDTRRLLELAEARMAEMQKEIDALETQLAEATRCKWPRCWMPWSRG